VYVESTGELIGAELCEELDQADTGCPGEEEV
jgi:hypothetical protein